VWHNAEARERFKGDPIVFLSRAHGGRRTRLLSGRSDHWFHTNLAGCSGSESSLSNPIQWIHGGTAYMVSQEPVYRDVCGKRRHLLN
jgi:hypothetical protein